MIQMYLVFFSDVQKFNAYMHLQNNDKSVKENILQNIPQTLNLAVCRGSQ